MSKTNATADVTLDAVGASCPGPIMTLIGEMKTAEPGTVVRLQSGDEHTAPDVEEWTEKSGDELLGVEEYDDHWEIYVRKRD
jgi:TusA-related sulfurtransferase